VSRDRSEVHLFAARSATSDPTSTYSLRAGVSVVTRQKLALTEMQESNKDGKALVHAQ
jgi:hypothetical protein